MRFAILRASVAVWQRLWFRRQASLALLIACAPVIRIHAADHHEADLCWRALQQQELIDHVELHVAGSYLMDLVKTETGWTSTQREALADRNCQLAALAAH